ncbi:ATP-binding protein [Pseudomonas sp. NPDC090202]|uniref:ATP-binding protein n=1 Tax=unclassified Pseudomonas TaxID=196821 RepID=UPI003830CC1D
MEQLNRKQPGANAGENLWFLNNGGEVCSLLRTSICDDSPLGPPAAWSVALKTLMATTLPVRAQIVIFWGTQYVALYNDAYAPSIGDKHPKALGRPAIENWTELWDDLEPLLRGVRETGQTFSAKDRPFYIERGSDGETVYFDVSYSAVREADGAVGGVLCIVTETTERVAAERKLREMNEGLEQRVAAMVAERETALAQLHEARKMEMVGQISGGVAHDFNNLLTPIMASLELIRRRIDDERTHKLTDAALQAADRARMLVGRLLTFARRQTLKPEAVDLQALISDLTDLIERSVGPTITVEIAMAPGLSPVLVDPRQLELAVLNLAVNARDAMPDGGRLTIAAASEEISGPRASVLDAGRYIRLSIADNGCGMSADTLKRCVEPFYSTKAAGKGTGLGLSMVQGLAMQSGGGFDIDSAPGQGTRISLWFPVTSSPVLAAHVASDAALAPTSPSRVLLVDDEELVRYTTALLLKDLGYQVTEAASGAAAMRLVEDGLAPDILITDQMMAEQTGIQLAHQLRQQIPDLPVLIISGYANLKRSRDDDYDLLAKPFSREDIAARLSRLTAARR